MKCLTDAELEAMRTNGLLLDSPQAVEQAARSVVEAATRLGLVLTVEQQPLKPLAMGHYETTVMVRKARYSA